MRRIRKQRRGASAMEFALVAPVLVLLVAGIIDYGWFFFAQQTLESTAHEATRTAALTAWEDSPVATAESDILASLDGSVLDPTRTKVSATYEGLPPQVKLTVTVASEYPVLLGLLPMPDTVESQLTMSLEDQPTVDEYDDATWGSSPDDA